MDARAVDNAASRLHELRTEMWEELGLAAVALGLSLVATGAWPTLALPLFLGGIVVGALGVRAMWRRWDLVDHLAAEPEAYAIPEVLAYAAREATMERRHGYAVVIRGMLGQPALPQAARISAAFEELDTLAEELEDAELALDPASAVACMRLVSDLVGSPLLNLDLPPEDLRSRVLQILSGFHAQPADDLMRLPPRAAPRRDSVRHGSNRVSDGARPRRRRPPVTRHRA